MNSYKIKKRIETGENVLLFVYRQIEFFVWFFNALLLGKCITF